jgi:hypothetical protein
MTRAMPSSQRLLNHQRLRLLRTDAAAMPWPVDQDHPIFSGLQVAERLARHFQVGTRAMNQHMGWGVHRVAPDRPHSALRQCFDQQIVLWISALQDPTSQPA